MSVPRMRTVPVAFRELKAADPATAFTLPSFRAAVNRGEIPFVQVGGRRFINLDQLFETLNNPAPMPQAETGVIRPVG